MRHRSLLGTALLSVCARLRPRHASGFQPRSTPGKLPKDVLPHAYRIELVPDLARISGRDRPRERRLFRYSADRYRGSPAGRGDHPQCRTTSRSRARPSTAWQSTVEVDRRNQTAKIVSPQMLAVGPHTLTIEYSGTILPRPEALFYSTYDTPAGRRWVACHGPSAERRAPHLSGLGRAGIQGHVQPSPWLCRPPSAQCRTCPLSASRPTEQGARS